VYDTESSEPGEKADYLLFGRRIIAELKCVERDPTDRIQALADQLIAERKLFAVGRTSFARMFEAQPDYPTINAKALAIVGRCLQKHVEKANRQIRGTREREHLPNALGLLLLANTGNVPLTEDLLLFALDELFRGCKSDGSPKYQSINAVLYIPTLEAHFAKPSPNGPPLVRCWWVYREHSGREGYLRRMIEILIARWSKFNGGACLSHSEALKSGAVADSRRRNPL
jgi:hypothetical protein